MARDRLAGARATLDAGFPSLATSAAYYAMLYAARAWLSEADLSAKTHRGAWDLFQTTFVATGRFDPALFADARKIQRPREAADYDAIPIAADEAREIVELAGRFVSGVEGMLGA